MNRIKYLILILLSITFISNVKAIVSPTSDFYVNDYANILSSETEQYIMEKSIALNNIDGTQIVVVTVSNLEGMSIEDYSIRLARNFEIGSKEKDNGLLILIALEERELRIEVGYGLEGIIPDGKAGRFRDQYMIPYLKENNWDDGIKNGYDAFYKEIVTLNNLNVNYNEPIETGVGEDFDMSIIFIIFMGYFIGIIIKGSKNKKRNSLIYLSICGIVFIIMNIFFASLVILLLFHIVFFLIGLLSTGSFFVFPGGGGFSSRGSSGGGLSGGGGSFGGGGASGKF